MADNSTLSELEACRIWAFNRGLDGVVSIHENLEATGFPETSPCSDLLQRHMMPIRIVMTVTEVLIVILVLLNLGNFIFTCMRLWEVRSTFKRDFGGIGVFLLLLSFLMVVGFLSLGAAIVLPWTASPADADNCQFLYYWISATYVMVSFCVYNLLYYRSRSVLSSRLFVSATKIQFLLKLVYISTLCVPLFVVLTTLFFKGVVTPPGSCNVQVEPWLSGGFLAIDSSLSFTYLFLFLYPVYSSLGMGVTGSKSKKQLPRLRTGTDTMAHSGSESAASGVTASYDYDDNQANRARSRVMYTARKNLRLSFMTIFTSFLTLTYGTVGPILMQGAPTLDNLKYQIHIHGFFTAVVFDRLVVTYVFFTITTKWRPSFIRGGKGIWYIPHTWIFREDWFMRKARDGDDEELLTDERLQKPEEEGIVKSSKFDSVSHLQHSDPMSSRILTQDTIHESSAEEDSYSSERKEVTVQGETVSSQVVEDNGGDSQV